MSEQADPDGSFRTVSFPNPEDLAFGQEPRRAIEARQAAWDQGIGYADRQIFELYLKLPVPARKTARDVIAALAIAMSTQERMRSVEQELARRQQGTQEGSLHEERGGPCRPQRHGHLVRSFKRCPILGGQSERSQGPSVSGVPRSSR